MRKQYNVRNGRNWDVIRYFLSVHFKFNTRLDTPFWQACRADVDLCEAADIVKYYQENGPSVLWRSTLIDPLDQFGMEGYLSLLVGQQVPYRKRYYADETAPRAGKNFATRFAPRPWRRRASGVLAAIRGQTGPGRERNLSPSCHPLMPPAPECPSLLPGLSLGSSSFVY